MSKMRQTLIQTPAGPVLFQDFRPLREKPVPGYHFGEGFVGQFCRCAAGSLLGRYATFENDERYMCDTLRYYPYDQRIQASSAWDECTAPNDAEFQFLISLEPDADRNCVMWLPSEERFHAATDQGLFCRKVAERYAIKLPDDTPPWHNWRERDPALPNFVTVCPAYLRAATMIIEATPKVDRWKLVKRLQVDLELLDLRSQALLIESRLVDV